ncbi:MAG: DUF424 family protein [Thermoplasmata archaeon]|nr:DUF424 family protein [Thermoplasmata archaeon]
MANGIVMRIHRVRAEVVVAACDEELIGRALPVGSAGRTVQITSFFYGERAVSEEELLWALGKATSANLLGPRVLALAHAHGFVAEGGTGLLGGVPHAEIFTVTE